MKPTTLTTCDDNVPHTTLFMDEEAMTKALHEHYEGVWQEVGAEGDCPADWRKAREELQNADLLRDRHIVHIQCHDLFAIAAE